MINMKGIKLIVGSIINKAYLRTDYLCWELGSPPSLHQGPDYTSLLSPAHSTQTHNTGTPHHIQSMCTYDNNQHQSQPFPAACRSSRTHNTGPYASLHSTHLQSSTTSNHKSYTDTFTYIILKMFHFSVVLSTRTIKNNVILFL